MSNNTELNTNLNYSDAFNKIILTFPIYYKIFQEYYTKGKNVSEQLDRLYFPLFNALIEYYYEFMDRDIDQLVNIIKDKYKPDQPCAIIDYLEYLFGNILYETFLAEIKKIDKIKIRYEYLCVFEYIIKVELYKHKIYENLILNVNKESKLLLALEYRIARCEEKIGFCLGFIKFNYPEQLDFLELCENLIKKYSIDVYEKTLNYKIKSDSETFIKNKK